MRMIPAALWGRRGVTPGMQSQALQQRPCLAHLTGDRCIQPIDLASAAPPQRSLSALEELWGEGYFRRSQQWRLAFREFGTTLGVQARLRGHPMLHTESVHLRLVGSVRPARRSPNTCSCCWRCSRCSPLLHALTPAELLQVNSEAGPEWGPRVDHLHSFWAGCLFTRDAGAWGLAPKRAALLVALPLPAFVLLPRCCRCC